MEAQTQPRGMLFLDGYTTLSSGNGDRSCRRLHAEGIQEHRTCKSVFIVWYASRSAHHTQNLRLFFLQYASRFAGREYLVFENERYTYRQAFDAASDVANTLSQEYHVRKGDRGLSSNTP